MVTGSHWPVRTARQDSLVKASIKNKLAQYGAYWPSMEHTEQKIGMHTLQSWMIAVFFRSAVKRLSCKRLACHTPVVTCCQSDNSHIYNILVSSERSQREPLQAKAKLLATMTWTRRALCAQPEPFPEDLATRKWKMER